MLHILSSLGPELWLSRLWPCSGVTWNNNLLQCLRGSFLITFYIIFFTFLTSNWLSWQGWYYKSKRKRKRIKKIGYLCWAWPWWLWLCELSTTQSQFLHSAFGVSDNLQHHLYSIFVICICGCTWVPPRLIAPLWQLGYILQNVKYFCANVRNCPRWRLH